METNSLISSGIIELYCMGIASDQDKILVEQAAAKSKEVRDEITAVCDALYLYSSVIGKEPREEMKNKIMDAINAEKEAQTISFPPRITKNTTVIEWLKYMADNKITQPSPGDDVQILDLPGNEKQVTYIAWAKKGVVVEESHADENEYLLMLIGRCSITLNGVINKYKAGDVIYIPKNSIHRAEALSDELMLLIGQRVAA